MKMFENNIKYALYTRKSTESEDRQVQSIEDQIFRLKELASRTNIKVVKIYKESKSAGTPNKRPLFEEMIKDIEDGKIDGILCWQIDRLSRNPIDSGRIQYFLQAGILKVIQTISKTWLPDDNAIIFSIESGQATEYRLKMIRDVKRGFECKRRNGQYPHLAPLGYLNKTENGEHFIVKDPERFFLVRKMWDLMLEGKHTPPVILKTANNEWGFRTRKFRKGGGNKLSRSMLYNLLSNSFYKGTYTFKEEEYKLKHIPMVTEDEFDRIQVLLGKKRRKRQRHIFPFTGLLRCAECGCLYTAEIKTKVNKSDGKIKKYTYYHCTRKKTTINCSQRYSIREDHLEEQIIKELDKITILPVFKDWAIKVLLEEHHKEINDREQIRKSKNKALVNTQRYIDNLIDLKCKEDISEEEYAIRKNEYLKDKEALSKDLENIEQRSDHWLETTERVFNFISNVRTAFNEGNYSVKRNILMALGKGFDIKDGKLYIEFNDWLVPIDEGYKQLEEQYLKLELENSGDFELENEIFEPLCRTWLGIVDEVRTFLLCVNEDIFIHKFVFVK